MKKMIAPLVAALALGALPAMAQDAPAAPAAAAPPAAEQPKAGGQHKGMKPLAGRVTAKADDSLTLTTKVHGGGTQESKVAVGPDTRFSQIAPGAPGDLTEGYLVAIAGERQEGKIAATGILRLAKPEGKGNREAMRGMLALGRGSGRLMGPVAHGQKVPAPTVGRIVSLQPLTIQTIAARKGNPAEKVEVVTSEATRILCLTESKLADIEDGASVVVLLKPGAEGAAAAAGLVVQVPKAGKAGRGKGKKK